MTVGVIECDNAESMAAVALQYMLAGADSVIRVPVMDISKGAAVKQEDDMNA